jgi:hypothetical protein
MSNFPISARYAAAAISVVALLAVTVIQPAAAQAPAAVAPTPTAAPQVPSTKAKGKTGARRGGRIGHAYIAYISEDGQTAAATSDRGLARTGFDLLGLAIFGGLALGGSACLFGRCRRRRLE